MKFIRINPNASNLRSAIAQQHHQLDAIPNCGLLQMLNVHRSSFNAKCKSSMLNVEHISSRSTVGNPQEVRCSAAALQCLIGDPACRLDPPCRLPAGWPPAFSSSHPCARICPSNPPCFQEPTSSPSPKPNQPTRLLCDGVSYLRQ